ncbi:cell division protein FtsQ/DivIB [Hanstruepera ponticola]|uniref:cell division protein FtsQ/DivIB n=1 Tax=Hanstruepera ponticola TaxID=2042995 RepID=UPI001CA956A1|nr:cell division protein FtsQ/DivIB [Hanstruepera ponticola]
MIGLLLLVVMLYAFSNTKNNARKVSEPEIVFEGENNLFITHETVSKLLIQNQAGVKNVPKETLDLNQLETALNKNPMIRSAQVFVDVNGKLTAEVQQKKPIARVFNSGSFYIDDQGGFMPLSTNYTARVPIVTGVVDKNNLVNVYKMSKKIESDNFLKKHVTQIHQDQQGGISLRLRQCNFNVYLGSLKKLDKKINNLKVFYKKATKEKLMNKYSKVNLQFDSQVICTKS